MPWWIRKNICFVGNWLGYKAMPDGTEKTKRLGWYILFSMYLPFMEWAARKHLRMLWNQVEKEREK